MISRRDLLRGSAAAGLGLFAVGLVDGLRFALPAIAEAIGYGPLQPDPAGLLDLPAGFSYQIVTQAGRPLTGRPSAVVPGRPDGPDNITVNPWGGLIVAEDGVGTQHLVAIVDGSPFILARNALSGSGVHRREFLPRLEDALRQHPGRGIRARHLRAVRAAAAHVTGPPPVLP